MSRDHRLYLEDILESCAKVRAYTEGMSRESFEQDSRTYDAVVRNLEIIGEASKHVPEEIRATLQDVAWKKISGLRDFLAHAYFGIDNDILWDIVTNKVPELNRLVEAYLKAMP